MMRVALDQIRAAATRVPPGLWDDFTQAGTIEHETLVIEETVFHSLRHKWMAKLPSVEPSLPEKALTLWQSLRRWKAAGYPRPVRSLIATRLQRCRPCVHWQPGGYLGLGGCAICGCSGLKLWLPTEQCPLPEPDKRWHAAPPP